MIRIIAMDDQPLIIEGMGCYINEETDMRLVGSANHGSRLMGLIREQKPDIAIVDFGLRTRDFDPIASIRAIKKEFPDTKILIFSHYNKPALVHALVKAGASGYVLKWDDLAREIARCIRIVCQGGQIFSADVVQVLNENKYDINLTEREITILMYLAEGRNMKGIAERMGLSAYRLRSMAAIIYDKLGVERERHTLEHFKLVNKARKLGLLPDKT